MINDVELNPNTAALEIERATPHEAPAHAQPHWLVASVYGRELLQAAVRKLHPEVAISMYRDAPDADDHLEMVINELGLHDWKKPETPVERFRYILDAAKMYTAIRRGEYPLRHLLG